MFVSGDDVDPLMEATVPRLTGGASADAVEPFEGDDAAWGANPHRLQ